jgi:hypothetical protein
MMMGMKRDGQRLGAGAGRQHAIAQARQERAERRADILLVIDDEQGVGGGGDWEHDDAMNPQKTRYTDRDCPYCTPEPVPRHAGWNKSPSAGVVSVSYQAYIHLGDTP